VRQRITSHRLLWPDEQPQFLRRRREPATILPMPPPAAVRRAPSLVLLQGGKR
jgi:hypothetical protein